MQTAWTRQDGSIHCIAAMDGMLCASPIMEQPGAVSATEMGPCHAKHCQQLLVHCCSHNATTPDPCCPAAP